MDLPVGTDDAVREEAIRIPPDRIPGAHREANIILADGWDDAGDAERTSPNLVQNGRRLGVTADLSQYSGDRDLSLRSIEDDLSGDVGKAIVVGPEIRPARNRQNRFGILQRNGPLTRGDRIRSVE